MKKNKQGKNRDFIEREIAELGKALNRLPADRQELLDSLDSGRVDELTAPESSEFQNTKNRAFSGSPNVKCTGLSPGGAANGHGTASRPHGRDDKNGKLE